MKDNTFDTIGSANTDTMNGGSSISVDAPPIRNVSDDDKSTKQQIDAKSEYTRDQENHEQKISNLIADRQLRERYGFKAYKVVKKSLWGWAILLAIYAACKFFYDKELFSENVLIAITSATTLNIFAAFLGVIRGLFPVNGNVIKESEDK